MIMIPYTHWMYFDDRGRAEQCAGELAARDFLCGIDRSHDDTAWLLRAARETSDTVAQHKLVEEITIRHGGQYDGGETGLMDPSTGKFIRQAES